MSRQRLHGRWRHRTGWPLIGVMGVLAIAPLAVAEDQVITVTRTDDPAPDGCRPGDCSLREAVTAANTLPGADVVKLPPGVFKLQRVDRTITVGPDQPTGQGLYMTGEVVLRGAGREQTVVDLSRLPPRDDSGRAGPGLRAEYGSLTIEALTVRDAQGATALSAIDSEVTLRSVAFVDNAFYGVIVSNDRSGRPVLVEDSLFAGNASGGLLYFGADRPSSPPVLEVRRSTFAENGLRGMNYYVPLGASQDEDSYQVIVEDSRFHRNDHGVSGQGSTRISRSSFTENHTSSTNILGGAMDFGRAPVLLEQVLVESNTALTHGGGVNAYELVSRVRNTLAVRGY